MEQPSDATPDEAEPALDVFPLSAQQRGLWFFQQLDPQSAAYNMPLALELTGALDTAALERALSEIVRRHEALRTTFTLRDGEPCQQVHAPRTLRVPQVDLSGLREPLRDAVAHELRRRECARPFDLEVGPLLRARLLRLGERRHELQLVVHHIVIDGWSEGVLINELTALYEAFRHARPSPLPDLPIQFVDYALWQETFLASDELQRQLAYWRRQLADLPVLEFTPDPAGGGARGRGELVPFTLSSALSARLKELARVEGVTLFVVLMAAFKLLLSRYTSCRDVAVGTILANRVRRETRDLIGLFVNNVVLRSDLSGALSFRGLMQRVQATLLEAYEHPDVPFDTLVEALNPERGTGGMPLIQAEMVFQNTPTSELQLAGIELRRVPTDYDYSLVALALSIGEQGDALAGSLMYSTELFARPAALQVLRHFEHLLEAAVEAPDRGIDELPLLTDDEWRRWIVAWNDTRHEYPEFLFFQDLFERQARLHPGAPAVVQAGAGCTYAELNARANRVAHHLRSLALGPESRVGICLERGATMVAAVLGVLKAGAAYVPLDPAHPRERQTFILRDAQVEVLLTSTSLAPQLRDCPARLVLLDDDAALDPRGAPDPPRCNGPEDLAYIIYTSGSTGTPKGVMIAHAGLSNMVRASLDILGSTPRDRFAQLASLTFDASVAEIMTALGAGASVAVIPPARLLEGAEAVLRDEAVTTIECAPSLVALLSPEALPALHTVVVGGEACPPAAAARWIESRRLFNAYGPTEVTIAATMSKGEAARGGGSLAIGQGLANVRLYVLDDSLNPVPMGVPGEICVGGIGVARGYAGRPGLTAERFVPDRFSGERSSRLYRSGDRGRLHVTGHIEFLGRLDDQVKLRGHRIEVGEIEAALLQVPGVHQCVVTLWADERGEKRLAAYVVAGPGVSLQSDALRESLARRLPEYMLPAAYVHMDALPRTTTGKLLRRGLPAPQLGSDQARTPPRNVVEELLARVWADVLGLEQVGIHDDFFALGGHSLLATKVVARARDAGLRVTLQALFEARTVASLAERLRAPDGGAALAAPALRPRGGDGEAPLSFAQQRLWLLDQMEPGGHVYNMPLTLALRGELRIDLLRAALEAVIERHEVLRTSFPARDGQPRQAVAPEARADLERIDLGALPPDEREAHARARIAQEVERPFDLARGPLLRTRVYALGEDRHVLCLVLHHIIGDALSLRILLDELAEHYEALRQGRAAAPPALALQYGDVAAWERDWLQGDVLRRHLDYWQRRLDGAPALALPADLPRPRTRSMRCGRRSVALPAATAHELTRLGRDATATEFMVHLALVALWLGHWSGQRDVLVGAPISNRRHVETEPLIGFFVDTVVLRTQLDEQASFAALLASVRTHALQDYAYQALPFEKLVDELGVPRDPSRHPLIQVMFNMVSAPEPDPRLGGLEIEDWDAGLAQSGFDLHLGVRPCGEGAELVCTYSSDLFRAATIEARLETFGELARLAATAPETPLAQLTAQLDAFDARRARAHRERRAETRRDALRALPRRPSRSPAGGEELP